MRLAKVAPPAHLHQHPAVRALAAVEDLPGELVGGKAGQSSLGVNAMPSVVRFGPPAGTVDRYVVVEIADLEVGGA